MSDPVCVMCGDRHVILTEERGSVLCTHCPVPCDQCRANGTGAYCATTPCPCACHDPRKWPDPVFDEKHLSEFERNARDDRWAMNAYWSRRVFARLREAEARACEYMRVLKALGVSIEKAREILAKEKAR